MPFSGYPQPGSPDSTPGEFNNPNPTSNTGATNVLGYPPGSLVGTDAGSTSNVTGYYPDILTISQEAAELAGVDATNAYFLRSVKRSLDLLSMAWANKGLNLWTLSFEEIVLVPGTVSYLLPQDTVDLLGPAIRTFNGGTNIDITIARQDFLSYLSQPNKSYQGKPNTIFVQRKTFQPEVFLWPVPNNYQTYTLIYWRLRRMQNTGYATNIMDVPYRFVPALIAGLAYQLAMKKKVKDYNLINMLKANYKDLFTDAILEDRDRSPVMLVPYNSWR